MSDSEEFSADEEEGKEKFRPAFSIEDQPLEVIKRIKALKKLQFENIKLEVKYYEECHKLDLKYQKLYDENNIIRTKIVKGEHEPKNDELEWKDETIDELVTKLERLQVDAKNKVTGIPDFWLTVFQNANESLLSGLFEPIDEAVFKYLEDVTLSLPPENKSFTLVFHFAQNPYFENTELTKEYEMKHTYDPEDPLDFDGPEMFRSKGCKINWKAGKNTTVKVIKQKVKQKGKGKGGPKFVTKNEKRDSFFNFFSPPKVPEDDEDIDDVLQAMITEDFDIGYSIKEKLIPRAVLYYTGEALEDDSDEEEEDDDEDDDEEED